MCDPGDALMVATEMEQEFARGYRLGLDDGRGQADARLAVSDMVTLPAGLLDELLDAASEADSNDVGFYGIGFFVRLATARHAVIEYRKGQP